MPEQKPKPEPKYTVGQVLMYDRASKRSLPCVVREVLIEDGEVFYSIDRKNAFHEPMLRPLTDAECGTRPASELERLAREVVESRCEVESTKIYSSARVVANRKAANAFGALAAFLAGPSQKGKQENG